MRQRSIHLAKLIKQRRTELNISQVKLNILLGWKSNNGQAVCNIEKGIHQVPVHVIDKLSSAIMVSREEIIDLMVKDYQEALKKEVLK